MIVAQINTVNYGSTGKIMEGIQQVAQKEGHTVYSYFGLGEKKKGEPAKRVGSKFWNKVNSKLAHVTGLMGFFSVITTLKLINDLKTKKIELIHLHNIHISFLNYPLLFNFIKKNCIKVVWTFHDCWPFTGHCAHFTFNKCDKWINGCFDCRYYNEYPATSFDNSRYMYKFKKKLFTNIEDMTIVTPSYWLKGLVERSFLKDYPVRVINNGIDNDVFQPLESCFRKKYDLEEYFIILGVSFNWNKKKGLDVFIELNERLEKEKFKIVLVGTNSNLDKELPKNIISIHRTNSAEELSQIYSAADVVVNPTREDVFGLVNIEANACGTPVIMFNTGGCPECINEKTGIVVDVEDVDSIEENIRCMAQNNYFCKEECVKHARNFNLNQKYTEYLSLYG